MSHQLPSQLIKAVAAVLVTANSHDMMDRLFKYAGAPGDPPGGSKIVKATEWLRRISATSPDPLNVVGRLVEDHMEAEEGGDFAATVKERREQIERALGRAGLRYQQGGRIIRNAVASRFSVARVDHSNP
jgi:hypothetical protein